MGCVRFWPACGALVATFAGHVPLCYAAKVGLVAAVDILLLLVAVAHVDAAAVAAHA